MSWLNGPSSTPASLRPRRQPQPVSAYDPRLRSEGYQAATTKGQDTRGQATPFDTLEYPRRRASKEPVDTPGLCRSRDERHSERSISQ